MRTTYQNLLPLEIRGQGENPTVLACFDDKRMTQIQSGEPNLVGTLHHTSLAEDVSSNCKSLRKFD